MMLSSLVASLRDKSRYFWVNNVAPSVWTPMRLRRRLLQRHGVELDDRSGPVVWLYGGIVSGTGLKVGSETFIGPRCHFEGGAPIVIGCRCNIAMEVFFCTPTHELGSSRQRAGAPLFQAISVGDGCWIGARALILPGVSIGEGCIIAAGAVVARNCEPNGLYAGVPARRIRDLPIS